MISIERHLSDEIIEFCFSLISDVRRFVEEESTFQISGAMALHQKT